MAEMVELTNRLVGVVTASAIAHTDRMGTLEAIAHEKAI